MRKVLIAVGVGLALVGGIIFFLLWRSTSKLEDQQLVDQPYEKGEVGYQEPQTKVATGTKEVSKGKFVKVEDGNIFFEEDGVLTQIMLSENEVVLACTSQSLASVMELDYDLITSIKTLTPQQIGTQIPVDEAVVILGSGPGAFFRAHTVVVGTENCQ